MYGTYLAAALIVAASILAGAGLAVLAGRERPRGHDCAVGLAALLVVASLLVKLPGDGVTAAVLVLLVLLGAALLLRRQGRPRVPREAVVLGLLLALALSLPFLASGRVGLPGVSLNNDTTVHLLWSESLRSDAVRASYQLPPSYPLGPHSLMASVADGTGIAMDHVLTGLLLASSVLLGLAALGAGRDLSPSRRVLTGLVVGLAYLAAAYFGEGAFKETMQALFVVAFALCLRDLGRTPPPDLRPLTVLRAGLPLGLLAAGSVLTYSYTGLVWFVAGAGLWLVFETIARHRDPRPVLRLAAVGAAAGVVTLVAISPTLDRVVKYFDVVGANPAQSGAIKTGDVGNLAGPLSPYSAFGIWRSADFRFPPADMFGAGLLAALGVAAALLGLLWWLRRRDVAVPAMAVAAGLIFLYSRETQSPYVSAKALVILAPLVALLSARALLAREPAERRGSEPALVRMVAAAAFVALALLSSTLTLRGSFVAPADSRQELGSLRSTIGAGSVLFLGHDDFVGWKLRPLRAAHFASTSLPPPGDVELRKGKRWAYGQPFDVDNVEAADLARFRWVITSRTSFQSAPPPSLRLVRQTASFSLYERTGPIPPRRTIEDGDEPGGVLDCSSRLGRRVVGRGGEAGVWTAPPVVRRGLGAALPGQSRTVKLPLPAGTWDLSLQYTSPQPVDLSGGRASASLPARLDRPGPFVAAGRVRSAGGPVQVRLSVDDAPLAVRAVQGASFSGLAAVRAGTRPRTLPVAQACGRYVDWYRPS